MHTDSGRGSVDAVTEKHRLWSRILADELITRLNSDAKFKKLASKLDETIQLRCLDTPEGTDVAASYKVTHGNAELVEWDERPSPAPFRSDALDKKKFLARTTAPYGVWVKLDTGEFGVIDAILSPHYKFEGAKLKILRNIRSFQRISEISQTIDKRY